MPKGKFEIYKDKTEHYRFRLKAANGQIIASSEAYNSKAACLNGIESVRKNASNADLVEVDK
ncbi:MAG: YegP family protein [Candidatus Methanofastidiosia archaeon]